MCRLYASFLRPFTSYLRAWLDSERPFAENHKFSSGPLFNFEVLAHVRASGGHGNHDVPVVENHAIILCLCFRIPYSSICGLGSKPDIHYVGLFLFVPIFPARNISFGHSIPPCHYLVAGQRLSISCMICSAQRIVANGANGRWGLSRRRIAPVCGLLRCWPR